jgi:type VI secretion system protein ImpE
MSDAQALVSQAKLADALAALQTEVRARPADPKLRVFLFQLLCVMGQWPRALNQLQVCGELDPGTLAMVGTYREAVQCEAVREAVFAGKTLPHVFGEPQAWVAWLAEALQADARGDIKGAGSLREQALESAPVTPGTLDGEAFEWIADADSRLGPVLEAIINGRYCWVPFAMLAKVSFEKPEDLRDLVWAPAHLEFPNGGGTVALVPARYPGSSQQADDLLRLARRTEWRELGNGHWTGLGQRMFATSAVDASLLECREVVLDAAVPEAG